MTTLVKNKSLCVEGALHTPNKAAISVVAFSFAEADYFTFCEVCEQNIESFSFYDEDRGTVYSKWVTE
jgi:predicted Fe-Mo cluster-binding NifX family protein